MLVMVVVVNLVVLSGRPRAVHTLMCIVRRESTYTCPLSAKSPDNDDNNGGGDDDDDGGGVGCNDNMIMIVMMMIPALRRVLVVLPMAEQTMIGLYPCSKCFLISLLTYVILSAVACYEDDGDDDGGDDD